MSEYKVQFEVFEGPLDLLLYLVRKEEVDIYEVNLTQIASQFVEYVTLMRELDLDVAGEFLVMASTLMLIKSRELLPVEQQAQTDGDEDEEDPRWELIRQLVEYKKFKDAAAHLQGREFEQEQVYPRLPGRFECAAAEPPRPEVSLFDLLAAVNQVLQRHQEKQGPREIFEDRWTVSEKIEQLRRLLDTRQRLRFSELFAGATSRSEVVATFLAMLELIRLRVLCARQSAAFSEIQISRAESQPAEPAAEALPAAGGEPAS
jgi:segregation and condensation protein A